MKKNEKNYSSLLTNTKTKIKKTKFDKFLILHLLKL